MVQKDTKITSLKGVATSKDQEAKEAINSKNHMKENLSKFNKELVGKIILKEERYDLWDQLALEVTKLRTHFGVV